jgi:hypothetical protein
MAVLVFLLVLVYFPNKPKLPPSLSATEERVEFKKGLIQLARYGTLIFILPLNNNHYRPINLATD